MRKTIWAMGVAIVSLLVGFVAGAWWYAETLPEWPRDQVQPPIATRGAMEPGPTSSPGQPLPARLPADSRVPTIDPGERETCKKLAGAFTLVTNELSAARTELSRREELRLAKEGTPVPSSPERTEPRFAPETIRAAVAEAFAQSRVPGRVQGLDCTEWPCIVFGRLRGAEDQMEKLEGAKALAAYEGDVATVLLWAATDEAAREGPLPVLPGRAEQSLFALAFYPRGLARPMTDNLDRRLRSRTAELWNAMSPADETGR